MDGMLKWATGWLAVLKVEMELDDNRPDIRPDGCPGAAVTEPLFWIVAACAGAGMLLFLLWVVPTTPPHMR